MFAAIASLLAVGFLVATIALPIRQRVGRWALAESLAGFILRRTRQAALLAPDELMRKLYLSLRAWLFASAAVFLLVVVADGRVVRDDPFSVIKVIFYMGVALALAGAAVFTVIAYAWAPSGFRALVISSRSGLQGLRVLDAKVRSREFSSYLSTSAQSTSNILVLDVTGFELFVERTVGEEGYLVEILRTHQSVPVSVLLLDPNAHEVDPDRQRLTVFQTVLGELQMSATVFMKRLRRTLASIATLNESRPPEAQIEVRYYSEKPGVGAIVFDRSMLVSPWSGAGQIHDCPSFQLGADAPLPSLYESFRRHVIRLWSSGVVQVFPEVDHQEFEEGELAASGHRP